MASAEPVSPAIDAPTSGTAGRSIRPASPWEKTVAIICKVLHRLVRFRAFWLLQMEPSDFRASFKKERTSLEARMISGTDLESLTGQHRDLGPYFIARSIRRGDWCHAYFDGDRLASYGWCSTQPTRMADDYMFEFPAEYFYMHRGFTLPEYRGRRLNAHGMVDAINAGLERGLRGLVGLVEVQNVASLRSADRLGQRRIGKIIVFRLFGRWFTLRTPGCRQHGCNLTRR